MTTLCNARRARVTIGVAMTSAALLVGCRDKSTHASDGDTGAASPATRIDLTRTPNARDSTAGVAAPTGRPDAMSGDTMGTRAKAPAQAKGPTAGKPTRP